VWETTVNGRELHFDLYGINNQNFIMRDRETGSWWQQVSGEAMHGPLKGKKLKLVAYEEMSFDLWKQEQPGGRVLLADPEIAKQEGYPPSNWEERVAKLPVVGPAPGNDPLKPRDLIVGLEVNGKAKAYPFASLKKNRAIIDSLEGVPLLVLLGEDNLTVRAFEIFVEENILDLYVKSNPASSRFLDVNTGSEWNFEGLAVSGPLAGKQLRRIPTLKDYWFDWKNYHPDTRVYLR
jgi:Protein of unknown function (DUF3179)